MRKTRAGKRAGSLSWDSIPVAVLCNVTKEGLRMKNGRIRKMLSLLLCAVLVIGMVPVSARAVTMTGGEVLYLTPNSNWKADGARFAIYVYDTGYAWASMTDGDGDGVYEATVPEGSWTNVIFCRMNGSTTENNWDNKWHQSGDLEYDGTNNHCTIDEGQWDCGTNVTWSVYTPSSEEPEEPVDTMTVYSRTTGCGATYASTTGTRAAAPIMCGPACP